VVTSPPAAKALVFGPYALEGTLVAVHCLLREATWLAWLNNLRRQNVIPPRLGAVADDTPQTPGREE